MTPKENASSFRRARGMLFGTVLADTVVFGGYTAYEQEKTEITESEVNRRQQRE